LVGGGDLEDLVGESEYLPLGLDPSGDLDLFFEYCGDVDLLWDP
jgi:hypothetical protein